MSDDAIVTIMVTGLLALGTYYLLRFRIDDWFHQRHLRSLPAKLAKEFDPVDLSSQLQEQYSCFWAHHNRYGWHVHLRLPDFPGATWPPFLHSINKSLRTPLRSQERLRRQGTDYDKERYYGFAGNRSSDLGKVAEELLNRLAVMCRD